MSRRDPMVRMRHMLDHAHEAVSLLGEMTEQELGHDRVIQLAITRLIEIVGEAASQVPSEVCDQYPDIPWRQVVGMRHLLAHGYDQLDYAIIHDTVRNSLPPLIDQLTAIFSER